MSEESLRAAEDSATTDDLDYWSERLASVPAMQGPLEPLQIATYAIQRMTGPRMPHISAPHIVSLGAVLTAKVTQGRVVMTAVLGSLHWQPGQELVARPVLIGQAEARPAARLEAGSRATDPAKPTKVGDRGRVLIPATIRAWMDVTDGAELTVVALPRAKHAVMLPWATLASMLGEPLGEQLESAW